MDRHEERSPDGRLLVQYDIDHGRMSHEIWTPTIVEAATGQTLLVIRQHGIDGRPQWRPSGFTLGLRCYRYPHLWLSFAVDLDRGYFRFDGRDDDEPLDTLTDRVDEALRRQIDATNRRGDRQRRPRVARDVGVALMFVAIVGAAVWFAPD